jgi:MraZ protein
MIFTHAFDRTIDAKSRLQIPSSVRDTLQKGADGIVLYLVPGTRLGTLAIYPEKEFNLLADHMDHEPIPDSDALTYQQVFYSLACKLDMDKQGRVALPDRLLQRASISREVVLTGAGNHLDLWNKADYERFIDDTWSKWPEVQRQARAASRNGRGDPS